MGFATDLKKAILKMAVSGKLTKQLKSDGSAEDLYIEIQKAKEQLIKDKKVKKEKQLKDIDETELPFDIPKNWKVVFYINVCYGVGNKLNQIQAKDIKKTGKFPVVSQGLALIDGYCDESTKVVNDIPVIMFGDHTKNVKFIDFDFVIGADGTKFLKPILVDAKYFYYFTLYLSNTLKDRGYARHFSLLCKENFYMPPLSEQHRIVEKLDKIMPEIDEIAKIEKELVRSILLTLKNQF